MAEPIKPTDPEWSAIYSQYLAQNSPGVVEAGGVMYHAVRAGDEGLFFCAIPNTPSRSSLGSEDPKWRGYYPPIPEFPEGE